MKIVKLSLCGNKSRDVILNVTERFRCHSLASGQVRCQGFACGRFRCFSDFGRVVWSGWIFDGKESSRVD